MYRTKITDSNLELPKNLNREFYSLEEAYTQLYKFVHSFDGKKEVIGYIENQDDYEEEEYIQSKF